MAQQKILVRVLPPTLGLDYQMYARNLMTGAVKMIPRPTTGDPHMAVVGEMAPGVWVDPAFALGQDNSRVYTIEV